MFLNMLSDENKDFFLDLAIQAALANGVIENEEKNVILQYALEMNIPVRYASKRTLEDLLIEFDTKLSDSEKKQVLFEIVALLFSDGKYDSDEKAFAKKVVISFGMNNSNLDETESLVSKMNQIYKEVYSFVSK